LTEMGISALARYGDEGINALTRYGPDGLDVLGKYGDEGLDILTNYGDDLFENLSPEQIDDFLTWKQGLSPQSQALFQQNPELWRAYADMDPNVRDLVTKPPCPCIPSNITPEQVQRIDDMMDRLGISDDHPGLREYLNNPRRRDDLTQALDDLDIEGVSSIDELNERLDRAVMAEVSQPGATARRGRNGAWEYERPDGAVISEYEVSTHGDLADNRRTGDFFQSHHGIQHEWANERIPGYDQLTSGRGDDCPAILLRDSMKGTPHQVITARQRSRLSGAGGRTYMDERLLLLEDMATAGVPSDAAEQLLSQSDEYFGGIYRTLEQTMTEAELSAVFGSWKP
jgi:hypothetical protein